jgi:hypothetical protein
MKTAHKIVLLAFMLVLVLPTLQYFTGMLQVPPVNEHREKSPFPHAKVLRAIAFDKGYAGRVESYYSEHFPLRDFLLRLHGQIEYSLFGTAREVVIGRDGWLADKKLLAEHLHQLDQADATQIRTGVLQLKKLQYWLERRHVHFLMVIVPLKPSVYPEQYPEKYGRRAGHTGLERFQEALALNGIPFVDVRSEFMKHKAPEPLYYRTDMHWNTVGSSRAAQMIVDRLSLEFAGGPIWHEDLVSGQRPFQGEELKSIPLLRPPHEDAPFRESAQAAYVKVETARPDLEEFRGTDSSRATLPPTIMFGNSFMLNYPTVGYHNYFSESDRVLDYQYFKRVLDAVQPKHRALILHLYETQLQYHVMPSGRAGAWSGFADYWDPRIKDLPLPPGYRYRPLEP